MITPTFKMSADIRPLNKLIKEYPKRAARIIDKTAINVQGSAKKNTHTYGGSSRDTSAMINGWVVNLASGGKGGNIPEPDDKLQAVVGNEVDLYPLLWEIGHAGFAPEPSLGEAIESEQKSYERAWNSLLE